MEERNWITELDIKELPEPYATIAQKIGIENAFKLAQMYQGMALYLPKLDDTMARIRDKKIKAQFNGYNYKQLAIKYNLTERWIREIVKEAPTANGQISLLENVL